MRQAPKALEYAIKAAYLSAFATYLTWPEGTFPDPRTPLVIGVLGQDRVQTLR